MTLEQIRQEWTTDEPKYKELADYVERELAIKLSNEGIFARTYSRVKGTVSLVKKLYKLGLNIDNYRNMNDKAGVRAICRYKNELTQIADCIRSVFDIVKEENKSTLLEVNQIGYRSYHFDVTIKKDTKIANNSIKDLICEIQVRTLCEDAWAEINHHLGYKPYMDLQPEVRRRLFCLGGLLEVADDCFTGINHEIVETTNVDEHSAANVLEPYGIKFFMREFDKEFTIMVLKELLPIFGEVRLVEFQNMIKEFVDKNADKISFILKERKDEVRFSPFLSQPELIVIFLLIETEPFKLKEVWERNYPIKDLERFSTWWGKPMDDLEIE